MIFQYFYEKKSTSQNNKSQAFYERVRILLAIIFSFITFYLLLAFVSFLLTGKIDQSKLDLPLLELIKFTIVVENWAGKSGAFFSDLFINKWFGIASIVFIPFLFLISLRFFGFRIKNFYSSLLYFLLLIIWLSITLSFGFKDTKMPSHVFIGGEHGYFISKWLEALLGFIGTVFLLMVMLSFLLIFGLQNTLKWVKKISKSKEKNNQVKLKKEKSIISKREKKALEKKAKNTKLVQTSTDRKNVLDEYDPKLDLSAYNYPPLNKLKRREISKTIVSEEELEENKNRIVSTLLTYNIEIAKIEATIGPTITLYEIVPAEGVRIAKIKNLEDDIALSLSALGIRIIAPMPGKGTVGIEVPNRQRKIVSIRSILASEKFQKMDSPLPIAIGKTISNETFTFDLTKLPHLLIAGATGQGKSVGLNAIITSLLYKKHPAELKFVMIDPKKVELSIYSSIEKHFLAKLPGEDEPIIIDTQKVIATLNSLCEEMERRSDILNMANTRDIIEYNQKIIKRKLNPKKGHKFLPYIVLVIDEFADLIMIAGKEIEIPITRLAQRARSVGIHMIIATQRPSTNVITGIIKANFPARIAFKVVQMIDSRTIIDRPGANQLIGRGDMLFNVGSDLIRLQCAFIDTTEIERITKYIRQQQGYPSAFMLPEYEDKNATANSYSVDLSNKDPFFEKAAYFIVSTQQGSTSAIRRRFSIGHNRAGRVIDQLEVAGIVGPFEGSKARQVLIADKVELEELLKNL